jgi:hypothetical protein
MVAFTSSNSSSNPPFVDRHTYENRQILSAENSTPQIQKINSTLIETSLADKTRILENRIDDITLLYLDKINKSASPSTEFSTENDDFEILEENIDELSQRFLEKKTFQKDIHALIEIQENFLSPFKKTIDRHGNTFVTENHLSKKLMTQLEELQTECADPHLSQMINELQKLRMTNLAAYQTKTKTMMKRGNRILNFITKPRIQESDPQKSLSNYEISREKFPFNAKIQTEYFKKWLKLLTENKSLNAIQNIYEDVKPIAEQFGETAVALQYFSELDLSEAISDYKEFALKQFKLDFTRTSKIVFKKFHLNNRNDLSNIDHSNVVIDWSFEEFTKTLYWSCFSQCLKEPLKFHGIDFESHLDCLLPKFDSIFAKIVLFASQAGDAELSQFCSQNGLYIPLPNASSDGRRELYIKDRVVKKVTIASSAIPSPSLQKEEFLTDGCIRVVQKYNYVKGTTSIKFSKYEDKDGNFLS